MDPTALLTEALEALDAISADADQRSEAVDRLRALADWLDRGGFPPAVGLAIDEASLASAEG